MRFSTLVFISDALVETKSDVLEIAFDPASIAESTNSPIVFSFMDLAASSYALEAAAAVSFAFFAILSYINLYYKVTNSTSLSIHFITEARARSLVGS